MNIYTIQTTPIETNTYLVTNGKLGFLVDPGGDEDKIDKIIHEVGDVSIEAVLLTHAHADHIGAVKYYKDKGAKVYLHKADLEKIGSFKNYGFALGIKVQPFEVDVVLEGGEKLNVAGLDISVIHTPGHSKGGVCYVVEDSIFPGDTIFAASYGRVDMYDGDFNELKDSIENKLFTLKGNYKLYPGHGPETSLELERNANPICW